VWKERWFSLADDGHLVYWKNEKVRVQLSRPMCLASPCRELWLNVRGLRHSCAV
jgi:hypothetical protein